VVYYDTLLHRPVRRPPGCVTLLAPIYNLSPRANTPIRATLRETAAMTTRREALLMKMKDNAGDKDALWLPAVNIQSVAEAKC